MGHTMTGRSTESQGKSALCGVTYLIMSALSVAFSDNYIVAVRFIQSISVVLFHVYFILFVFGDIFISVIKTDW